MADTHWRTIIWDIRLAAAHTQQKKYSDKYKDEIDRPDAQRKDSQDKHQISW